MGPPSDNGGYGGMDTMFYGMLRYFNGSAVR